jgi:nitroreductase
MQLSPEQLNELIKNRRSIFPKQFAAGKVVPTSIIEQILINASWAPNHGQTEPWQFNVFSGEGLKTFANFQAEMYRQSSGENFLQANFQKMLDTPLLASHIISIGMKRTTTKRIPEIEDIEAVACAVQNMYLTTTAYGIGGYWTTGGTTYLEGAKSFFGLNDDDKLLGFFYIGEIEVPSPAGKRTPINEKVNWIS